MDYRLSTPGQLFHECAQQGNRAAWSEFVNRYHKTIIGVVTKTLASKNRASAETVEDMVQEVYTKLCDHGCRTLRAYRDRGPSSDYGYIKVIAIHAVRDAFRRNRLEATDPANAVELEAAEAGSPSTTADLQRTILLDQVAAVFRDLGSERDRQIFDLFYRVGLTAAEISRFPTINLETSGVESVVTRITRSLREKLGPKNPKGKTARGALS